MVTGKGVLRFDDPNHLKDIFLLIVHKHLYFCFSVPICYPPFQSREFPIVFLFIAYSLASLIDPLAAPFPFRILTWETKFTGFAPKDSGFILFMIHFIQGMKNLCYYFLYYTSGTYVRIHSISWGQPLISIIKF